MAKYVIVDFRMREEEKRYLKSLGYQIINSGYNTELYDEIAAHVDISYVKVGNEIIVSPDKFVELNKILECNVGKTELKKEYPNDVPYNVCIMGKKAIHNFKYTDPVLKERLIKEGYELIDVSQGYTKCSIAVIDDNSCITNDIGIAKILMDKGIDVLFVYEPDIHLLKRTNPNEQFESRMYFEESDMQGFIGGAMVNLGEEIVLFGDLNNLLNKDKIVKFIESKSKKITEFKGLDIIDYGGIITIEK